MGTSLLYVKLRHAMHGHDSNDSFARQAALAGGFIGKRVGNYLITKLLGSGGMGDVYIAEHPALGKRVAVKFLSDQLGAQIAERFLAEARAVTLINHPGVVEILDFGELEGHLYYVMELLEGRELEAYARDHGKLSANEVLPLLSQIAAALEAVHALGVVHRDLKPTNIFVVEKGGPPTVKLLDFGIAKVFSPTHPAQTIAGQVLGTPAYMSPEQAAGQTDRIGPHTDIYSLGVVLYELLCGQLPFVHELPLQVMAMHLRDLPPPLVSKDKTIAPLVCAVVEKCLRKNPEERPKSARLLLQAFEAAVERSAPRRSSTSMRAVVPARKTAPPDPSRQTGFQEHPAATQTFAPAWPPPAPVAAVRVAVETPPTAVPLPVEAPAAVVISEPRARTAAGDSGSPPSFDFEQITFGQDEELALDALMRRIKRKGDFPAFARNVSEVSRQAMVTSKSSAADLATLVLRDYSVATKLLRHVNSALYRRFGGTVSTISQAIVVLGFDQVRTTAMSLTLFGKTRSSVKAAELVSTSVASLVCGEIARKVAHSAGLRDTEEAFIAAMFRHLGKHLVLFYLPELHDRMLAHMTQYSMTEEAAARRVLGLSYEKLGMGVAKRWGFSQLVMAGMADAPVQIEVPRTDSERLLHLACFATEAFTVVSSTPDSQQTEAFERLSRRYRKAIPLSPRAILELIELATQSFKQSYQLLLGVNAKQNSFLQAVERWTIPGSPQKPAPEPADSFDVVAVALAGRLELIATTARHGGDWQEILRVALETLRFGFPFTRALYLVPDKERRLLRVRLASGDTAQRLVSELRVPLAKGARDPFSMAFFKGGPVFVGDVHQPEGALDVPSWFVQQVGARAFYVQPVVQDHVVTGLLYGDAEQPLSALREKERVFLDKLATTLAAARTLRARL